MGEKQEKKKEDEFRQKQPSADESKRKIALPPKERRRRELEALGAKLFDAFREFLPERSIGRKKPAIQVLPAEKFGKYRAIDPYSDTCGTYDPESNTIRMNAEMGRDVHFAHEFAHFLFDASSEVTREGRAREAAGRGFMARVKNYFAKVRERGYYISNKLPLVFEESLANLYSLLLAKKINLGEDFESVRWEETMKVREQLEKMGAKERSKLGVEIEGARLAHSDEERSTIIAYVMREVTNGKDRVFDRAVFGGTMKELGEVVGRFDKRFGEGAFFEVMGLLSENRVDKAIEKLYSRMKPLELTRYVDGLEELGLSMRD